MKHRLLTFALMGAFASTMLFSCKNAEEPLPPVGDMDSGDMIEYSISVNVPDEMRTRAASTGNLGSSGIYEFPLRTIDKLWYAMYYDGSLKSQSTITRNDNNPFSISLRVDGDTDPSKVWFFFWAGNSEDVIYTNQSNYPSGAILSLDYNKRVVELSTSYFFSNLKFYDSFTGYFPFSTSDDKSVRTCSFTLKRPFAQFHLLTDDFLSETSDLYKDYPQGIACAAGFGTEPVSNSVNAQMQLATKWHFDEDPTSTFNKDDLEWTFVNTKFVNPLNGSQRTTFKDRKMDYLGVFFTFATTSPDNFSKDKLNFAIAASNTANFPQYSDYFNKYISVQLPEEGIKANNKYVIYNKSREDGGSGFLDGFFDYEILVNHDGVWDEPNTDIEADRE